jgi:CubicO group peptidase (beta-lactamase class C family)
MPECSRHHAARSLLAATLLVVTAPLLQAQGAPPTTDSLRTILEKRVALQAVMGLVAGHLVNGQAAFVAAGSLRAGSAREPDNETLFEIGSVAKALTGTLLADMVIRGEVALEDPVQRFLPDTVRMPIRNGREITLLDLATHTSGLPRLPDNLAPPDQTDPYAGYEVEDLYAFLSGHSLGRDIGATYEYSNLGAGLLAHVLSLRAGKSLEDLMRERILAPLGMTDTWISLNESRQARLAQGHAPGLDPTNRWTFGVLEGAGAWHASTRDLMRLAAAALSPAETPVGAALALATEPRRPTSSPGLLIGLGWHIHERGDQRIIWHNGSTGGYHAYVGFNRSLGLAAAVVANTSVAIDDIGQHLVDPASPVRHPPPPRPTVAVSADTLRRYAGRYQLAPGALLTVTFEDGGLQAQITGQSRYRIHPATPTRFFWRVVDAEIEFHMDTAGVVTAATLYQAGRELTAQRIAP